MGSLSPSGRLLLFGSSTGPIKGEILENVTYIKTHMVSQADLEGALSFYEEHQIHPILSQNRYKIEQYEQAYRELEEGKQFGKIVMSVN